MYILLFFLMIGQIWACKESDKTTPDVGTFEGKSYTNVYFNFKIQIPDGWFPLTQEMIEEVNQQGKRAVAGEDTNLSATIEASEENSINLFMVYEKPPGTPVLFNASLGCFAEKVSHLPGIKSGSDYLLNMKRLFEMSQLKLKFPEDINPTMLNGVGFDILTSEMEMGQLTVKQKYYSTIMKGYSLGFILTYMNEEQYSMLKESIDSISFKG